MARLPDNPFEAASVANNPFMPPPAYTAGDSGTVFTGGSGNGASKPPADPGDDPFAPSTITGGVAGTKPLPPPGMDWSAPSTTTGGFDKPPGQGGGGGSVFDPNYLYNQNPYAGLAAYEQGAGIDQTGAFGRFLGQQANNLYNGYTVASASNPNLNYTDYIAGQRPSLDNWFGVAQTANYAPVRRGR